VVGVIGANASTTLCRSTKMTRREGQKTEARRLNIEARRLKIEVRRAEGGGVLWEGMFPFPPAGGCLGSTVSSPVGSVAEPRRPGDLERSIGLQSRSWCRLDFVKHLVGVRATE